jgi:sugar phosphate isomerase/epimerase
MARVLLKARPTEAQLADRLAAPVPAGLELYLDADDIASRGHLERLARRLVELKPNPEFVYVVEGPVRSLDGSFFDLSADTLANREVLDRIGWLARAIGAEAILVHAITPMSPRVPLSRELHRATLDALMPLVERYAEVGDRHGVIPLLENIPPVARQREGSYMSTIVGMSAHDLVFFAERFPTVRVAVDLSHAGLFLNGLRIDPASVEPELAPIVTYLAELHDSAEMTDYLALLEPYLFEAHVSNARGLIGEGLSYGDGDLDLDALTARLAGSLRYLVTEIIEADPNRGVHMREAQRRMEAVLRDAKRVDLGRGLAPALRWGHAPEGER